MLKHRKRLATFHSAPKLNLLDRCIGFFDPVRGVKRFRARTTLALAGGYTGASKTRRGLKEWSPFGYDADSDLLPDLAALRERSRDLIRNTPLATGAIKTKVTNVVGTGLKLQSRIDRDVLNLTEEQADAWEAATEREWRLFWDSKECDAARTLTGDAITRQVYRQVKENGDVFVVLPRIDRKGFPYSLKLQVIEADRVCNLDSKADTPTLSGGIEKDQFGAPIKYHILKQHPGALRYGKSFEWDTVAAFGEGLGLRNVIHVFSPDRPGQSRGVPDLASVIEPLKQLDRYTEAELMAAVVSGMFTVFIETDSGENPFDLSDTSSETGSSASDKDCKLGNGAIVGLARGEKIHDTNPGRPNDSFDPFVMSVLRQIGVALELPFEILIKHFTASYSAARAAILEAWKYFMTEREWLAANFNQLVYEIWMYEAIAIERISAPGFFADPLLRKAYLGSEWIGPAKGQIDEKKEIEAAEKRVAMTISTLAEETAQLTGGDWEKKHRQAVKEHNMRKEAGLIVEKKEATASEDEPPPEPEKEGEDNEDN
jgi:lambda family phage portal protein